MKLGHRYLLLGLAICGLQGCFFVAHTTPRRPAANVIVYSVDSPPPTRPVGWRRGFQFYYYPNCEVYYAPHRNCYIWKGPRGWMTTPQPPPNVVLIKADAINVEIENDDPVACHTEVVERVKPIAAKSQRRPKRVVEAQPQQAASRPSDPVKVEVNVIVEDHDDDHATAGDTHASEETTVTVEVTDKASDNAGGRAKGNADRDEVADGSGNKDKDKGHGKAKGKDKSDDDDEDDDEKAKGKAKGKGKGKG